MGVHENEADHADEFVPSDYLQAFSHFTYLFTNKRLLVCDLQGIFNTGASPPIFELSDPVIHDKKQKRRFGYTSNGQSGIQSFFNSHKCTGICKIMELSRNNSEWKKAWHRNFSEDLKNHLISFDE
jgi:hypothetical protein